MRINSYTTEESGSDLYRIKLPAQTLKAQGLDIEYLPTGSEGRDADVLVFSRPATRKHVEVIIGLVADGYAVVVDVDDLVGKVRPGHSLYGPRASAADGWLQWACREATLVTGTTQAIIDHYAPGKGIVIPNYIPEWYLSVEKKEHDGPKRVGWSGTVSSHPTDLQVTGGGVAKSLDACGADLAYIGPKEQVAKVKSALKYKRTAQVSGWFTLEDYPKALAQLDIGIVPLENCMFNEGKSWLKGLEMAAVGVPFIASPTSQYQELFGKYGAGVTARHPNDWKFYLTDLLQDQNYYNEVRARSRSAAAQLTIERNADRWADAFSIAFHLRKRQPVG
jgi:glycosyltransferase involved in cell wall biosynthesis